MMNSKAIQTLRQRYPSSYYTKSSDFQAFLAPKNMKMAKMLSVIYGCITLGALIMVAVICQLTEMKLQSVRAFFLIYLLIIIAFYILGNILEKSFPCSFKAQQIYSDFFSLFLLLPLSSYTFWERLNSSIQGDVNILAFIMLLAMSGTIVASKSFLYIRAALSFGVYITFELLSSPWSLAMAKNIAIMFFTVIISIVISHILLRLVYGDFRLTQELMSLNETLENLSRTDGLTGLPDRRVFTETLASEWSRAIRHHYPITLFIIDIDYFKQYNDHFGHLEGDKAIKSVATVLKDNIQRSGNLISRFGGDEFAAVLPHTTETEANIFSEILRCKVQDLNIPHCHSKVSEKIVTVSIGSATLIPSMNRSSDELFKLADNQLYKAKELGRNRVAVIAE